MRYYSNTSIIDGEFNAHEVAGLTSIIKEVIALILASCRCSLYANLNNTLKKTTEKSQTHSL